MGGRGIFDGFGGGLLWLEQAVAEAVAEAGTEAVAVAEVVAVMMDAEVAS